ncbi:hypothetical protein [Saccharomonospora sp. CUA-673]|nr:hypothetical protein [Saccharomonospora sp. CUA-673]
MVGLLQFVQDLRHLGRRDRHPLERGQVRRPVGQSEREDAHRDTTA